MYEYIIVIGSQVGGYNARCEILVTEPFHRGLSVDKISLEKE